MHIILIILLVLAFAYSLALVVMNNQAIAVNLIFSNVANMSLGLILVATIFLGVLIGILLALLLFRVFQNKWEISRLKKEKAAIQAELSEANLKLAQRAEEVRRLELEHQPNVSTLAESTSPKVTNDNYHNPNL
ncbi:lipopolysaccharide assembly protein LapA domain-containing protein [Moraxella canis]|uniref:lipopolysaccharide assembly protein LapA domain-containing protein n=1 Tax=Moraxella canis TaxID=90239 RepID=UPI000669AABB|nr:LapA family protein [Moraxella canis]